MRAMANARGLLVLAIGSSGCIIPPSLSVDNQDAGIDSPPSITSVRSDLSAMIEPGPYTFPAAPDAQNETVNLSLLDTDVNDSLYVRIYVDYTVVTPTAPRSTCNAVVNGAAVRTTTCSLAALCLQSDVSSDPTHIMEIVVFDREPLDSGSPTFKAIPDGGQSTTRTYQLGCVSSS
jgi:hypothetical protein